MPVILHDDKTAVVEAELSLPDHYRPSVGDWLWAPIVNGLMPIGMIIFDSSRDTVVLGTAISAYDYTTTIGEWLASRPVWSEAKEPFLIMSRKEKDDGAQPEYGAAD